MWANLSPERRNKVVLLFIFWQKDGKVDEMSIMDAQLVDKTQNIYYDNYSNDLGAPIGARQAGPDQHT